MESGKYYVLADGNNLYESMTKEQILSAIVQAVESHTISDVDTGFITTLKEQNSGDAFKIWLGTTAEYNAIQQKERNCLYILSDDTELEDLENEILRLGAAVETISALKNQILLNESVSYGTGLSVALSGDKTISDYAVVKVSVNGGDILCSTRPVTGDYGDTLIEGSAVIIGATYSIFTVRIYCDSNTNTIKAQLSQTALFTPVMISASVTAVNIVYRHDATLDAITKITGVC